VPATQKPKLWHWVFAKKEKAFYGECQRHKKNKKAQICLPDGIAGEFMGRDQRAAADWVLGRGSCRAVWWRYE
jgi:hypothetical protein